MIDDEDLELRRALDSYRVPEVSPAIADRVFDRLAERAPGGRGRYLAAGLGAATVLGVLGVLALRGGAATIEGRHVAAERETIELGSRGKAVVEGGADVRWHIGEVARVEQRSGSVFYRVEPGGPFVVETPAGTVEVRGTCFRVEVESMRLSRQHVIAAGLGAVVTAVAVVAVYEGGVRVVNARGSVELAAGERGRVESGSPPARDTARGSGTVAGLTRLGADASRAELVAQSDAVRDQLAAAQAKVARLEQELAEVRGGPVSRVDPTKEQLAAWAQKCEVHIDAPSVFGASSARIDPADATDWGLTRTEVPALERVLAELHEHARDEMREIYLAATGNTAVADEVTAGAMFGEIYDKALPADKLRARQRIARERAGMDPPPANLKSLPAVERALRLLARLGNDFEHRVGDALGAPRSHELRRRYDAWPGMRLDDEGCEERTR